MLKSEVSAQPWSPWQMDKATLIASDLDWEASTEDEDDMLDEDSHWNEAPCLMLDGPGLKRNLLTYNTIILVELLK